MSGRRPKHLSGKTQCEMILEALRAGHVITPLDALNKFRCARLASRIHDLKDEGYAHNIESFRRGDDGWQSYRWVVDPIQQSIPEGGGPMGVTKCSE